MSPPPPNRRPPRAVDHNGAVVTQADVERSITRISEELEEQTTILAVQAEEAAVAEVRWKRERAKTRLKKRAEGGYGPAGRATEDECDDSAIVAHGDLLNAYLIAEARYAATRDAMFTKRSQLDALRTIAANIRAQT
jgi:hypothetical protein